MNRAPQASRMKRLRIRVGLRLGWGFWQDTAGRLDLLPPGYEPRASIRLERYDGQDLHLYEGSSYGRVPDWTSDLEEAWECVDAMRTRPESERADFDEWIRAHPLHTRSRERAAEAVCLGFLLACGEDIGDLLPRARQGG